MKLLFFISILRHLYAVYDELILKISMINRSIQTSVLVGKSDKVIGIYYNLYLKIRTK